MKKRIITSMTCTLLVFFICAEVVPDKKAEKTARSFYYQKHNQFEGMISMDEIEIISTFTHIVNGIPYYHVFHFNQGGFVIVPAEDLMHPIIAYSFENKFDQELRGPANRGLMYQYMDMIEHLREQNESQREDIAESWKMYLSEELPPLEIKKEWGSVGPLITTLWAQGWPYNYYCPETNLANNGGRALVGCVATALQQIGYYFRWPDHGQGSVSYIPEVHPEYGPQSADFENTWYRWEEMCDSPRTVNTAIAEQAYHCAVGLKTEFGPFDSYPGINSFAEDSIPYYGKYLDYYPDYLYFRDSMTYAAWIAILKDNLDRRLPVYYEGTASGTVSHAFVCDGYQDSAYFHFNLGWGGMNNGYYHCDSVLSFNTNIIMTTERYPDTINFTYPTNSSGADTLRYIEGSIEDGSGPVSDYLSNHYSSWLIDPQDDEDSVTNLEIELKRLELFEDDDRVYVYDGNANTDPLLAEFSGQFPHDSTIITSGNQALVEFMTDASNTANGFYLSYYSNRPEWCSGTTQLTEISGTIGDGSGGFYYNNDIDCIWEIDPGIVCPALELQFNYFMTEDSADILYIYDLQTNELLAEYSGMYAGPPPPVVSGSGKMKLVFETNNCIRNEGWEANYFMVDLEERYHPLYSQIRPNPAYDKMNIAFTLYDKKYVKIELHGISGNKMGTLLEKTMISGTYDLEFDIGHLVSGIYFCSIYADEQLETKRLVVVRH